MSKMLWIQHSSSQSSSFRCIHPYVCVETFQVSKFQQNQWAFILNTLSKVSLRCCPHLGGVWVAFRTTSSTRVSERFAWVRCRRRNPSLYDKLQFMGSLLINLSPITNFLARPSAITSRFLESSSVSLSLISCSRLLKILRVEALSTRLCCWMLLERSVHYYLFCLILIRCMQMIGRPILRKQVDCSTAPHLVSMITSFFSANYRFYRPSASRGKYLS